MPGAVDETSSRLGELTGLLRALSERMAEVAKDHRSFREDLGDLREKVGRIDQTLETHFEGLKDKSGAATLKNSAVIGGIMGIVGSIGAILVDKFFWKG